MIQDDELRILLNDADWVPLNPHLRRSKTMATVRKLFQTLQRQVSISFKNYSTGELTIAEMRAGSFRQFRNDSNGLA